MSRTRLSPLPAGATVVTATTVVVAAVVAASLAGCGAGGEEVELPEDSIVLRENIPTDVEGVQLVGVNITEDGGAAITSPALDGGRATSVEEGDSLQVAELALTVVAVRAGDGDEEAPGGGDGYIAVTVD